MPKTLQTCTLASPTDISSNMMVRNIFGTLYSVSSGLVFSLKCATEEIGLITVKYKIMQVVTYNLVLVLLQLLVLFLVLCILFQQA